MNIKILDSWIRDYLTTNAKPTDIANALSLSSVGIERIEKWKNDYLYDIEITTNRPDLASVIGIAREASAVLPQFGFEATFSAPKLPSIESLVKRSSQSKGSSEAQLIIHNDPKLCNRICAVVLEVSMEKSPVEMSDRLESSDIRSLNTIVDVTNYIMRTIGYPTHVMDYDRLQTNSLTIRESKPGETITTLDGKEHELAGGDIVAVDDSGRIVDLLGIMGLENSVVTKETKRIVLFINHDNPLKIRKTSLGLGIRTEAAQLNEKELDPELVMDALLFGIELYQKYAKGKVVSAIIDTYPNKPKPKTVTVSSSTINRMLGVSIPLKHAAAILNKLGFQTKISGESIEANVPSFRLEDVSIPEDLVEEIARIYGYHNIPNILPPFSSDVATHITDEPFYWESHVKKALKYWGFTEVYTYPMVSETLYEGDTKDSVKLRNPLGEDFVYMRKTLVPSLLQVVTTNKKTDALRIFEIGNVYTKNGKDLPLQVQHMAIVIKEKRASFFEMKGLLEQLTFDLGITDIRIRATDKSGLESEILVGKELLGTIEILDDNLINMEMEFEKLIKRATAHKSFKPLQKYPPVIEDISLELDDAISTGEVIDTIKSVSTIIVDVSLLDKYGSSRTFHILYQRPDSNLSTSEVKNIREKIEKQLKKQFSARIK